MISLKSTTRYSRTGPSSRTAPKRRPSSSRSPFPTRRTTRPGPNNSKRSARTKASSSPKATASRKRAFAECRESSRYISLHPDPLRNLPLPPLRRDQQQGVPRNQILRRERALVPHPDPPLGRLVLPQPEEEGRRHQAPEHLHQRRRLRQSGLRPLLAQRKDQLRKKLRKTNHLHLYLPAYSAPEEVNELSFARTDPASSFELSETFSIGLTLLDAATLSDSTELYKGSKSFNFEGLEGKLKDLQSKEEYSILLKALICHMCNASPEGRTPARELYEWLSPFEEEINNFDNFETS